MVRKKSNKTPIKRNRLLKKLSRNPSNRLVKKSTRKPSSKLLKKSPRKPSSRLVKKSSRKPSNKSKFRMNSRVTPYFKAITPSRSVEKVDLNSLPQDILYSISKSLRPIDRTRLASVSKSTRKSKINIHEAPMDNIDINKISELTEYLNYFKYIINENINIPKITMNIKYSINETLWLSTTDKIGQWFIDILKTIGDENFKKIRFNISELLINEKYVNLFEYDKYKNIYIDTIYMVDIDTSKNINFLSNLEFMNIKRVICTNDRHEDVDICKYLCKVKTVSLVHGNYLPESNMDFSYFGNKDSKTINIHIYNFTQITLEYFSGMNCVYVGENGPEVLVNNLHNVKYLIAHSKKEIMVRNSSNIENLTLCVVNRGIEKFPIFYFNPAKAAENIHLLEPGNEFENRMVDYLVKNGVNVIKEKSPCNNPLFDLFRRFK